MSIFARYLTASTVSYFGTGVTSLALPLVAVIVLDASTFEVSLVTASANVGWLLIGLPAGVVVSHLPLRATQVATDLARAGLLLSIPVTAMFDALSVAQLVGVGVAVGICTVLFDVSNSTFIVRVVDKEELTRRNSQTSTALSTAELAGPTVGGVIVQLLGAVASVLVDVISYVVSAILLQSIPATDDVAAASKETRSVRSQIREGIDYILDRPVLRACTFHVTIVNFVCGAIMALTTVILVRELDAEPVVVGLILAMDGVGGLLAASFTPRIVEALGSARALLLAAILFAGTCLLMPLAPANVAGYVLFAVGTGGSAGAVMVISILLRTHRQTVTPLDFLPRVMATVRFFSWGAVPVGALAAGGLASLTGARAAFVVACSLALLPPVQLASSRVRRLRALEDEDEPENQPTMLSEQKGS